MLCSDTCVMCCSLDAAVRCLQAHAHWPSAAFYPPGRWRESTGECRSTAPESVKRVAIGAGRRRKLTGPGRVSWYGSVIMGECEMRTAASAALLSLAIVGISAAPLSAGQIDSAAYFHLNRGMSESEVLVRAGPPDLVTSPGTEAIEVKHGMVDRGEEGDVSFDSFRRTRIPIITSWHYVPGPQVTDPFITIVTFRAGEVWDIERTKVFSRYKPSSPETSSQSESAPASDTDIQRERADNTLKAAEAYAATRAKLKEQAGDEVVDESSNGEKTIYMYVQPDGSTYFGDTPPDQATKIIPIN